MLIGVDLSSPVQSRGALDLAKFLKTTFPNTPLFINGMHASFFGEEIMRMHDYVDILIPGEAEKIAGEIAETVEAKKDYSTVIGIISRANGKIIRNEGSNIIEDVDQIPPYSCDFLMPKKGKNSSRFLILNPENRALIATCAGPCKYDCIHCPNAITGYSLSPRSKTEFHSVDWILEQIKILLNGTNRFSIEDHCSCNGAFLKELTHAIRKEGLCDKINFFNLTVIPSQSIDREIIGNLSSAGINSIDLGIESGSDHLLKVLKRPCDTKQVSDIIRNANKNEIITKTYWMITGLERHADLDANKKFLKTTTKVGALPFSIVALAVFPETQLYNNPHKYNVTLNFSSFEDYQILAANTRYKRRKATHKTDLMGVRDIENAINDLILARNSLGKDIRRNKRNFEKIFQKRPKPIFTNPSNIPSNYL